MKHGGLILAGVAFALIFAFVPLTADEETINYQTYMVDTFDNPEGQEWAYHAVGSKFVTDGFPILKYFDGMPRSIRVMQDKDENAKYLGIQFKFNRKGVNWVDIFPTKEGANGREAYEIPFKGNIQRFDMWVWGAGYYYELELIVRDCEGRTHTLPMGLVNFKGWKNMHVSVPSNIPQSSKYIGNKHHMAFVAFRIRTRPTERVDDFKIFFDQFKALTDVYVDSYDGYELLEAPFEDGQQTRTGNQTGNEENK